MERDILLEVIAAKEAYAAEHNFDVDAILADLARKSQLAGRKVVTLPPKPAIDTTVLPRRVDQPATLAPNEIARAG